jgi:hypothetical protein
LPYTTPSTIATAQLVTTSLMNTEWVENIKFLANPPACRAYHNTTQSVSDGTPAFVAFNSERYDTDTMHSTSVATDRITFKTAGLYVVQFNGAFVASNDYVSSFAGIYLNSSMFIGLTNGGAAVTGLNDLYLSVSTVYKFAVNDYIQAQVMQNNSGSAAKNLMGGAAFSPEFSATWIGRG